jgi:CRP-like cAMP-binding protein
MRFLFEIVRPSCALLRIMAKLQPWADGERESPFARLLGSFASLDAADIVRVEAALSPPIPYRGNTEIARPQVDHVLNLGWMAEAAVLPDGRRQFVTLLPPGDVVDLRLAERRKLTLVSLAPGRMCDLGGIVDLLAQRPPTDGLVMAWKMLAEAQSHRHIRHIVRLGRLSAYERVADVLIEVHEWQRRIGLAGPSGMTFPLTQDLLADLLGLSAVHVNRTLQELRRDRLIEYGGGQVRFPDRAALAALAPTWG